MIYSKVGYGNSMKEVLLFTPLYPPHRGGGPNYYSTLVDHLSQDCSIVVLTSYHPDRPLRRREDGALVYRVVPRLRSLPRVLRALVEPVVAFLAVVVLSLRHGTEVVHSHSTSLAALGVAPGAALLSTPIIYDCRDEGFPRVLVRFGTTPVWFSCAENVSERLRECGVPADRIVHTPVTNPGYVSEYADADDAPADLSTITYVGRLREKKGVRLLLDAFEAYVSRFECGELEIVGDGPLRDELAARASEPSIEGRVTMVGEVSHRDAVERIAESDLVVLPSASEGTPRVVVEAIEVGTPVLATPVGTVENILTHGENGLIVDRSADELLDALSRLAENRSLLVTLSEGARATELDPDWSDVTESVLAGYERAGAEG